MIRMRSLRLRLLAAGFLATLVALGVAGFVLVALFESQLERRANDEAESYLRLLVGKISLDAAGQLAASFPVADPRFTEPYGGLYWQINDKGHAALRSRSLWDAKLDLADDPMGEGVSHHHEVAGPAGQRVLAVERALILGGPDKPQAFRAIVAIDRASIDKARSSYALDVILALAALGTALFLAFAVQVTIGLRPLLQLTRGLESVARGQAARLSVDVPSEVAPLVEELNRLLDKRDRMIERARGRAADLAHGLKTPLTALDGDVRRLSAMGHTELADEIGQLSIMMKAHVKRELARARIVGSEDARHITTLARARASVETIAAAVARTPDGQSIGFEIDIEKDFVVPMDRLDFEEAVGNLIENGARHGESIVRVVAEAREGAVEVRVEDDGAGVAEADLANLARRGHSGPDKEPGRADVSDLVSAGLGLSIVADIVEAYGGTLSFERSDLGGLCVRLRLRRR